MLSCQLEQGAHPTQASPRYCPTWKASPFLRMMKAWVYPFCDLVACAPTGQECMECSEVCAISGLAYEDEMLGSPMGCHMVDCFMPYSCLTSALMGITRKGRELCRAKLKGRRGWLNCDVAFMQELKVRELDVSYCNLPTSIITSLLTRATTLEVRTPVLINQRPSCTAFEAAAPLSRLCTPTLKL